MCLILKNNFSIYREICFIHRGKRVYSSILSCSQAVIVCIFVQKINVMENNNVKEVNFSGKSKHGLFGLLLIAVGVLFLAFNFGWLDPALRSIVFSWPMIFVVFAFVALFKKEYWGILFWLALAAFFLLPRIAAAYPDALPGIDENFARNFWPVLMIVVGVAILLGFSFGKRKCCRRHKHENMNFNKIEGTGGVYVRKVIFGGNEDIFLEPVFRGGKIEVVFAGVELDLRRTTLPEGDTRLSVEAVFGGIKLYLPDDWTVVPEIDAILGGVDNKRFSPVVQSEPSRRLIITGEVIFGGCELR